MNDKTRGPVIPGFKLLLLYKDGLDCSVWFALDIHNVPRLVRIVSKNVRAHEDLQVIFYRNFSEECDNLLHLLYAGETQECFYYVSQTIDNTWHIRNSRLLCYKPDTLLRRIQLYHISYLEIIYYSLRILSALEYLHDHGMIHGVLIPEHIVFVYNELKLADPVLIQARPETDHRHTEIFQTELFCDKKQLDIYALGKIIACMICNSCDPEDLQEFHRSKVPFQLRRLKKIALRCCSENPRKRYRNCRQVRRDIQFMRRKHISRSKLLCFLLGLFFVQSLLLGIFVPRAVSRCKEYIRRKALIAQYRKVQIQLRAQKELAFTAEIFRKKYCLCCLLKAPGSPCRVLFAFGDNPCFCRPAAKTVKAGSVADNSGGSGTN